MWLLWDQKCEYITFLTICARKFLPNHLASPCDFERIFWHSWWGKSRTHVSSSQYFHISHNYLTERDLPYIFIYSGDGLIWTTLNINFGFLQIKWEPMIVKKQMIPHLNALIMYIKIPDKEGRGVIRGLPRPPFVKSVLFRKKGRGKSLMLPRPCPSRNLLSTTIAKKWRIVSLCTTCSFWVNWA